VAADPGLVIKRLQPALEFGLRHRALLLNYTPFLHQRGQVSPDVEPTGQRRRASPEKSGAFQRVGHQKVVDVFEHAYMLDYGIKRADYIEAIMKAISWESVEQRTK